MARSSRIKYFGTPKLYKENGFREKKDAQELINWMKSLEPQEAAVMSVERKQEKKNPPYCTIWQNFRMIVQNCLRSVRMRLYA